MYDFRRSRKGNLSSIGRPRPGVSVSAHAGDFEMQAWPVSISAHLPQTVRYFVAPRLYAQSMQHLAPADLGSHDVGAHALALFLPISCQQEQDRQAQIFTRTFYVEEWDQIAKSLGVLGKMWLTANLLQPLQAGSREPCCYPRELVRYTKLCKSSTDKPKVPNVLRLRR